MINIIKTRKAMKAEIADLTARAYKPKTNNDKE